MKTRGKIMLLGLLAIVCLFGLFDHSLWSGNDTREGAMISEMVRTRSWVAPVFNGTHYLEKPPLLHWTGVLFCRLSGTVTEGLVRLPAAIYSFLTLLVVLSWARELGREQAGYAAVFMCASSALFFEYARIVLTDSALAFAVVFSLWLFWRAQAADKRVAGRYLLFLFASAFAFYAKGLVGPGMIWLSVVAWLSFQKRFRLMLILVLLFILVFTLVLAPWVAALWKAGGSQYLYTVFWENQFGRFLYFSDKSLPLDPYLVHKEPVYFYLLSLPVRLMPWTLLVVPALVYWFRKESPVKGQFALFLKTSLVAIVFLLHVSSAKAACYALPLFPFLFLMTAIWLEDAAAAWLDAPARPQTMPADWLSRIERALIAVTFVLTGAAVIIAPAAYILAFIVGIQAVRAPCAAAGIVCLAVAMMAIGAGCLLERNVWMAFNNGKRRAALLIMPIVVVIIGMVGVSSFIPTVDFYRSYEPFSDVVNREIKSGRRVAFATEAERDLGAFMFYLDSRVETVSFTNRVSVNNFLGDKQNALGMVVPVKDLKLAMRQLDNRPFKLKMADRAGKKSNSFRLITLEPAVVEEPASPDLKPKKIIRKIAPGKRQ